MAVVCSDSAGISYGRWAVGNVGDWMLKQMLILLSREKKKLSVQAREETVLSLLAKGWKTQLLPKHHRCKRDREQSPLWYLLSCCRAELLTSPQLPRGLLTLQVFDFERLERTLVLTAWSRSNVALMGRLPQRESDFNSSGRPGYKDSEPRGITG